MTCPLTCGGAFDDTNKHNTVKPLQHLCRDRMQSRTVLLWRTAVPHRLTPVMISVRDVSDQHLTSVLNVWMM